MKKVLLALLIVATSLVYAQEDIYLFHILDDNLVGGINKQVYSTPEGFIWIACDDGLIRYDGKTTKRVPLKYCKSFFQDSENQSYVIHDGGIDKLVSTHQPLEVERWMEAKNVKTDSTLFLPKLVFEDSKHNFWIVEGSSIVRRTNTDFTRYEFVNRRQSPGFVKSLSMIEDAFGVVWTITYDGNLHYFDGAEFQPYNDINFPHASFIIHFGKNRYWIGHKKGVTEVEITEDKEVVVTREISELNGVSSIAIQDGGGIVVGTWNNGLYKLSNPSHEPSTELIEIVDFKEIISLYFDANGDLWINSNETVGVLQRSVFKSFPIKGGMNLVESIDSRDGNKMVVSEGMNIYEMLLDGDDWSITNHLTPERYVFNAITTNAGLIALDYEGQIQIYNGSKKRSIKGMAKVILNTKSEMQYDRSGNIWVSGNSAGLYKVTPEGTSILYDNRPLQTANSIELDLNGTIYASSNDTSNYFLRYDFTKDQFESIAPALPFRVGSGFAVEDMSFSYYYVWLATSHGLIRISNKPGQEGEIERVNLGIIPVDESLKSVAVSLDGSVWIAGTFGLIRYIDGKTQLYDRTTGLISKVIKNRGLSFDAKNNLWIATESGVTVIPQNARIQQITRTPIIKDVFVNGQRSEMVAEMKIPNSAGVEFQFSSLEYPSNQVSYQTRILENNSNWSAISKRDIVSMLNSSPGTYTFQVRAQKKGAAWSEPASYPFTILRAWYQKPLTYIIGAVALFLLSILSTSWYTRTLKNRNRGLELQVLERTKEIRSQKDELELQRDKVSEQLELLQEKNAQLQETKDALVEANSKFILLKETKLKTEIESKNKQLTTHTLHIIQKNEALKNVSDAIHAMIPKADDKNAQEFKRLQRIIDESYMQDKDWDDFKLFFEEIYTGFNAKLTINYPELTSHDLKLCALIRLNLSINECATILGISPDSVKTSKFRLRKKLNLTSQKGLVDFLMSV